MIFNILIFIFVLSLLIISHELGHFIAARSAGVKVERFSIGFGPPILKFRFKDVLFLVCLVPLGGYVKLAGEDREDLKGFEYEFFSKPVGIRSRIVFFGPLFNLILGFLIFWVIFMVGVPYPEPIVGKVLKNYPAYYAGIKEGDKILKVNRKRVETWFDVSELIKKSRDEIEMVILRDGKELEIRIKPQEKEFKGVFGKTYIRPFVGIAPSEKFKIKRFNVLVALLKSIEKVYLLIWMMLKGIYFTILGIIPFKEAVAGPLGIYQITSQIAHQGLLPFFDFIGILSVSLAVINLFPLPVLDGGHLLFFLIEKIRGKPLPKRLEEAVNRIGMMILLFIMFLVIYNDILRIRGR